MAPGDREALKGGVRRADLLSPTLPLLLRSAGAGLVTTHRVRDDRDELGEALERAAREADLILTTGGASMGEADLVKGVLDDLGWTPEFWRIRIRPGSPVSFGHLPTAGGRSRVPILGLPGNPVSAIVTTLVLALPAVRSLGGHRRRLLRSIRGTALEPLRGPEQLTRFFRVVLEPAARGRWGARLTGHQGSGAIRSIAVADGLAVLPEGLPSVEEGEEVEILLLPEGGWSERVEEPA